MMNKITKLLKRLLTISIVLFVAGIAFLEIGSKYYKFPTSNQYPTTILVCDSSYYPVNQNKIQIIQTLVEQKRQGKEPSREDLERAITSAKEESMIGLNGVVCGDGMIFLRDTIEGEGKFFVARHEIEHVFIHHGEGGECNSNNEEYCATVNAARVYPIGFIAVILSSLYKSATESSTFWSFLFGSWIIFRTYIFPW